MASKKDEEQDARLEENDETDARQDKVISHNQKWTYVILIEMTLLLIGITVDILMSDWNIVVEINKICK